MIKDMHHLTIPPRIQRLHLEKEMKEGAVADDLLIEAAKGIQMVAEAWKV